MPAEIPDLLDLGPAAPDNWHFLQTPAELEAAVDAAVRRGHYGPVGAALVALDIETTGLRFEADAVRGVGFTDGIEAWYAQEALFTRCDASDRLFGGECRLVMHNGKFDLKFLCGRRGFDWPAEFHDTLLLAHIVAVKLRRYNLGAVAQAVLGAESGWKVPKPHLATDGQLFPHCCGDVWHTRAIFTRLYPMAGNRLPLYHAERELGLALAKMEVQGVAVDADELRRLGKLYGGRAFELAEEIYADSGGEPWNIKSLPTLREKLRAVGIPVGKQLTEDVLGSSGHPFAAKVLEYRKAEKLRSTYVDGILEHTTDGRVHCSFRQEGTPTGRLSCAEPNLQNIPNGPIRGCFVSPRPPETELLVVDYSQIEMRFFAHYSGEEALVDAFAKGEDVHRTTAAMMHRVPLEEVTSEMRQHAKRLNFGLVYGMGAAGLAATLGTSVERARSLRGLYLRTYPSIARFSQTVAEEVRRRGRTDPDGLGWVENYYRRRRYLPASRAYIGVNSIIQGTAGDFVKLKMVELARLLRGRRTHMVLSVHDEVVFVHWREEALVDAIVEAMEDRETFRVPITVAWGTGESWAAAK